MAVFWGLGTESSWLGGDGLDPRTTTSNSKGSHYHHGSTSATPSGRPFDNRPACYRVIFIVKTP